MLQLTLVYVVFCGRLSQINQVLNIYGRDGGVVLDNQANEEALESKCPKDLNQHSRRSFLASHVKDRNKTQKCYKNSKGKKQTLKLYGYLTDQRTMSYIFGDEDCQQATSPC